MRQKLSEDALRSGLDELPGWQGVDNRIEKIFEFPSYKDGLVFACAVGYVADLMDHHPDLVVGYRRVVVGLSTHDAGGVTYFDMKLAKRIESM